MTDAIITGPGLYVMRNGLTKEIRQRDIRDCRVFWDNTWASWSLNGKANHYGPDSQWDIIRRATPEEAAKFCGGGDG